LRSPEERAKISSAENNLVDLAHLLEVAVSCEQCTPHAHAAGSYPDIIDRDATPIQGTAPIQGTGMFLCNSAATLLRGKNQAGAHTGMRSAQAE
jgi:hypothetical protein